MRFFFFKTNDTGFLKQVYKTTDLQKEETGGSVNKFPYNHDHCVCVATDISKFYGTQDSRQETHAGKMALAYPPPHPPRSSVWCNQPILCNKYNIALRHLPRVLLGPLLFCTITGQKKKRKKRRRRKGWGWGRGGVGNYWKYKMVTLSCWWGKMLYFHNHPYQQVVHPAKR